MSTTGRSAADILRAELSKRRPSRDNDDADNTPTAENNAFAAQVEKLADPAKSSDPIPLNGPRVTNSIAAALSGPGTTVRVPRA